MKSITIETILNEKISSLPELELFLGKKVSITITMHEVEELPIFVPPSPKKLLYKPKALHHYTVRDLEAVRKHFPIDYAWRYQDLQHYFPQHITSVRIEIIQNQLFIMPSPNRKHQEICTDLATLMNVYSKKHKLGRVYSSPFDVKIDDDNVVQPDILYVSVHRKNILQDNAVEGVPDLVVEIWSPSDKKKEREIKHELYEKNGVSEYWTIYPKKREVTVEILKEGKYKVFSKAKKNGCIKSNILAGFEIDIAEFLGDIE